MQRLVTAVTIALSFLLATYAQRPAPTPPREEDGVVKISTDLIQIDVTVVDKDGKVVTDLAATDFEIFENGERQPISSLAFISRITSGSIAGDRPPGSVPAGTGTTTIRRGYARNTIAIVVDDLNLSFPSVYHTRKALRQFVDEQMRNDDLVAIIRTGGGVGALQQFTSDKRVLHAAIDKIRWNPMTSAADQLTAVSQTETDISERFTRESTLIEGGGRTSKQRTVYLNRDSATDKKKSDYEVPSNAAGQEDGFYARSSLASIRQIIAAMKDLPGRKTMMLFSDGITIGDDSNKSGGSIDYLQEVADTANRSSVVVYTFDTRGMQSMSITASDNTYEIIDGHREQKQRARTKDFKESQDGLVYFANQTGGKALLNANDLNGGIRRALDEQTGYYLLAYQPDAESFDAETRKFNKLEVRVSRPGVTVSYRSGFFAQTPSDRPTQLGVEREIANALMSPFSRNDISLNINTLYADDAADGSYVRSFLHIDARNLKFTDQPDGWKKATFDVAAVALDGNGALGGSKETKHTIRTKGPTYRAMLERGFVYVLIMPVKKHGVYQYRVAVRDAGNGMIGSASQIVEIPDLTRRKLTLSSLAVEEVSIDTWQKIATGKVGPGPNQVKIASTLVYDTVLRQFTAGGVLRYGFEVYNSTLGPNGEPAIETQARILQNDQVVMNGNINRVTLPRIADRKRIKLSGAVKLKDSLEPGDYLLQLVVFDRAGNQRAVQALPFEIVKTK